MTSNGSIEYSFSLNIAGLSTIISKTAVAPIDRAKLLLQLQATAKGYKGISDCLIRVVREQKFLSLWRGNSSNLIRYFPTQALNYDFKSRIKKELPNIESNNQILKSLFLNCTSGGLACSLSLLVVYPLDLLRTRIAADCGRTEADREFRGLIDCSKKIIRSDGIRGIYRGVWISAIGVFIYRAIYFGLYEAGREIFADEFRYASMFSKWMFAQAITALAVFVSYPVDTVRRRMMMQSGRAEKMYSNSSDCFLKIFKSGGFRLFFKGFGCSLIRSISEALVLVKIMNN